MGFLHVLLLRQLKKQGLSPEEIPKTIEAWKLFLDKISKIYIDADQDRYTMERSMEVSSREMQSLFARMEESQKIARLGSWTFEPGCNRISWSQEMYRLFERDPSSGVPSYAEVFGYIPTAEHDFIEKTLSHAIENRIGFEFEHRISVNGNITWVQVRGAPSEKSGVLLYSGTALDISKEKKSEEYLAELHKKLLNQARMTGMAEMAISVLHNIGNVLNSVNVISSVISEKLSKSEAVNLKKLSNLFIANQSNLENFLKKSPAGKNSIEYLKLISDQWEAENASFISELKTLDEHIQHIKAIIVRQQALSGAIGITESVNFPQLIEDALIITDVNAQSGIKPTKEYEFIPDKIIDKVKLLQILVNLIQNAKEALVDTENKELIIRLVNAENDKTRIEVQDNGIGIDPKDAQKIFSHGFTTKKGGHGFGLHVSSITAQELGGSLYAESAGLGKGACFVLLIANSNKAKHAAQ